MESFTLNVNASGPHLNENEGAQITSKPSVPTKALPAYTEPMQLTIHIPDETAALLQSRGVELSTLIVTNEVHRGGVNTSAGEYFVTNATASTCMTHPIALN